MINPETGMLMEISWIIYSYDAIGLEETYVADSLLSFFTLS